MGDKPQDPWKGTPEERLAAYWRKRAGISFSDFDALMGREDVTGEGKAQVRMAAVDLAAQPSAKLADVKRALVTLHIKSLPYTRQQYYMALALGVIEGGAPADLILLDWMLPLVSGIEVCRQIRTRPEWQTTKVVMLTAKGRDVEREAAQYDLPGAPPVPTTSIYSRSDGIVAWQCSVNPAHERAETIEIHASHIGMGGNPMALYAIADRLAQPAGAWRAFECDGLRKLFYRRP